MVQLYAARFEIPKQGSGQPASPDEVVRALTRAWIESWYKRWKGLEVQLPPELKNFEPTQGHNIQAASERTDSGESCWALIWRYPHPEDESLLWLARVVFSENASSCEFALTLQLDSTRLQFRPPILTLRSPRLVGGIAASFDCRVGPQKVTGTSIPLATADVDNFVRRDLVDPSRSLPLIVVSRRASNDDFVVDPDRLAAKLVGLAVVYALSERGTSYRLTDLLPPRLSCYNGAVRVYWPGFSSEDPPTKHPLYHPDIIARITEQGALLEDRLFDRLARISAFRYVDGPITSRVLQASKTKQKERQVRQLEDLRDSLGKDYQARIDEILGTLAQREEIIRSLEDENRLLKERLSDWRLYQSPASSEPTANVPIAEEGELGSVAEAVARAKTRFSDSLDFWPSALESAGASRSERYESVFQALEILHRVASDYFAALDKGASMGRFEDQFAPYRIKYSARESQTTGTKFRQQRTFTNDDRSLFMERHLTIGGGDRQDTVQIFFEIDPSARRFIVGYCGIHLDYARMRT
jgi:hypothetical protein